jgi:autotransporter-associated beta strand protein
MKSGVVTAILDGIDRLLNKTTSGTVVFTGDHTYTGATTLTDGVLSVATLNNGGIASGIGASTSNAVKPGLQRRGASVHRRVDRHESELHNQRRKGGPRSMLQLRRQT